MSKLLEPTKVKYFFSVLFNTEKFSANTVQELLESKFGELKTFNPSFNPLEEYYSKEMGPKLNRVIYYSIDSISRDHFVDYKIWATDIEVKNSNDNKRLINIDVGYVAKEQVLLATGKPYSHRIYLRDGVFAELVYFYKEKTFHKVPWTYPDYQHDEKIQFFNSIR